MIWWGSLKDKAGVSFYFSLCKQISSRPDKKTLSDFIICLWLKPKPTAF